MPPGRWKARSALALEEVRAEFKDLPILGVILPGAKTAVKQGKRIGVISTPATAKSNAYKQAIQEIDPTAQVWQIPCPEFVVEKKICTHLTF